MPTVFGHYVILWKRSLVFKFSSLCRSFLQTMALNILSAFLHQNTPSRASSQSPTRPSTRSAQKTCCRSNTRASIPTLYCETRLSILCRETIFQSNRKLCHPTTCVWVVLAEVSMDQRSHVLMQMNPCSSEV